MKILLEWVNIRLELAEERISKFEDRLIDIMWSEEQRGKRTKKTQQILREMYDTIKCTTIHVMGVPEGEKWIEKKFLMNKNFPNLMKNINL